MIKSRITTGLLTIAALSASLVFAQDELTAQQFAAQHPEPTFALQGEELNPVSLLELTFQCLGSGVQVVGDNLVTTGFDILDARAYELRGAQALATSLRRAEINAQTHAVEFLEAVAVRSSTAIRDHDSTTAVDAKANDEVLRYFSMNTVESLATVSTVEVQGMLRGGRKVGTKLISLGDEGMCVGVRYEVPVDQSGFDPVERGRAEEQTGTAPAPAAPDGTRDGFQAPPPGTIGDW